MVMALRVHREYPLILAANRDEFDDRPAIPACFWPDAPRVLAGRDERGGGTWLGVNTGGRLAMVTNVRNPKHMDPGRLSRGKLVADYLLEKEDHEQFRARLRHTGYAYNGFNLVFGCGPRLSWFSNAGGELCCIPSGVHGLSNALFNTPWPKVQRAKAGLWALLHSGRKPQVEELFALLVDTARPLDRELPDTGVGLAKERLLAPICVQTAGYGTQVSTLIFVHRSGQIDFWEKDVRARSCCSGPGGHVRQFTIAGKRLYEK
jgi:uncharacterized protein with NRDE domain